uniref:Secreted protein n=1 Tax=Mycena chlorophos TaxID=658473 RepID=A0ABQ0KZ80_MYCCL|nr:predicted protein [Mycena chlorophos]
MLLAWLVLSSFPTLIHRRCPRDTATGAPEPGYPSGVTARPRISDCLFEHQISCEQEACRSKLHLKPEGADALVVEAVQSAPVRVRLPLYPPPNAMKSK